MVPDFEPGSRITDPDFFSIQDPGSRSKNQKITLYPIRIRSKSWLNVLWFYDKMYIILLLGVFPYNYANTRHPIAVPGINNSPLFPRAPLLFPSHQRRMSWNHRVKKNRGISVVFADCAMAAALRGILGVIVLLLGKVTWKDKSIIQRWGHTPSERWRT